METRNAPGARRMIISLLFGAFAGFPSIAYGQAPDCTLPQERGGLIRGDQVPRGCVLESAARPTYSPLWRLEESERLRMGSRFYPADGIPIFFSLDPVVLVLDPSGKPVAVPRAAPRPPRGLERRPRNIRGGNFGPIFHPFGPVFRPFGRAERPDR